jgi:hypothetical protein
VSEHSPALAVRPMSCGAGCKVQYHGLRLGREFHSCIGGMGVDERGVRKEGLHVGHKLTDDVVVAHGRSQVQLLVTLLPLSHVETMTAQRRDRAARR